MNRGRRFERAFGTSRGQWRPGDDCFHFERAKALVTARECQPWDPGDPTTMSPLARRLYLAVHRQFRPRELSHLWLYTAIDSPLDGHQVDVLLGAAFRSLTRTTYLTIDLTITRNKRVSRRRAGKSTCANFILVPADFHQDAIRRTGLRLARGLRYIAQDDEGFIIGPIINHLLV